VPDPKEKRIDAFQNLLPKRHCHSFVCSVAKLAPVSVDDKVFTLKLFWALGNALKKVKIMSFPARGVQTFMFLFG
jgi:predicted transcriptional regulator